MRLFAVDHRVYPFTFANATGRCSVECSASSISGAQRAQTYRRLQIPEAVKPQTRNVSFFFFLLIHD